jgi:putative DNA primase/helicase
MSGSIEVVKTIRKLVWHHGFRCLPVQNAKPGDKDSGKAPIGKQWTVGARQNPPECLQWEPVAHALNTGILCDGLRVIDVDVDDAGMAGAVRVLAVTMLGATIIRTRSNSPRCLLVYRAAEGEPSKVAIKGASHSDAVPKVACKVEVLGKGQQFVAYGEHWTGVALEWQDGGPSNRAVTDCPAITDEQVQRFLNAAGFVIGVVPIEMVKPPLPAKPRGAKANGHDPAALSGDTFFAKVNELALTRLDDWVQTIFPQAVYQTGTGAWRVASKDRGRPDLEEDISLHPEGIQDFGLEHGLSAIDVVIEHGGAPTPMQAAVWLCDHLGVAKETLGWKAREKSNGVYAPDVPLVGDEPVEAPVEPPEPPEPPDPPDVPPVGDADGPGDAPPLPTIECRAGELPRMIREVQEALVGSGVAIYQRGMLVQPIEQQYTAADGSMTHSAALVPLSAPALIKLFTEAARFEKWDMRVNGGAGGWRAIDPPDRLVQIVLHNRSGWPFPVVRGVLTCPTLRPDGSILRDPGYDPISRYYLMFPDGLTVPDIAPAPTKADAAAALGRLKDLISSYPFNSKASRSVGLAMLMTQVLRCAMPVSPMLAVSARAPGTGKSHLVDLCSMVAIGRLCPIMGTGKNDEEAEKRINTMLLAGVPGFSIDNVHRDLDLDTLNQATERPMISIRVFGALEKVEVENSVVIYMTGNNLAVVDEQGRRTLRCELDAGVERPERRHFDGDPIYTARDKRGEYIADVLTIARAYHTGGDKPDLFPLGSYGAWSHFVREPLVWLGEADPAETMEETEHDDPATIRLRAIISGWYFSFTLQPKTLSDAVRDAQPEFRDTMKEHFPARGGIEVDTTKMGNWLRKFGGRIIDGMRFVKEDGHTGGTIRWKISLIV